MKRPKFGSDSTYFSDSEFKWLHMVFGSRIVRYLRRGACPLILFLCTHPSAYEALPRCVPNHLESVHDLLPPTLDIPPHCRGNQYDSLITEADVIFINPLEGSRIGGCKRYGHHSSELSQVSSSEMCIKVLSRKTYERTPSSSATPAAAISHVSRMCSPVSFQLQRWVHSATRPQIPARIPSSSQYRREQTGARHGVRDRYRWQGISG
jgi:hypothetical protein